MNFLRRQGPNILYAVGMILLMLGIFLMVLSSDKPVPRNVAPAGVEMTQ